MGKRLSEVIETIERVTGRKLPADFADAYQRRTFDAFRARLKPVVGAREFLEDLARGAECIASSSSPERLALSLEVLNMTALFEGRVFSASNVARGKPHPDIFLHAAERLGVEPADCIVIEDSVGGVITAARRRRHRDRADRGRAYSAGPRCAAAASRRRSRGGVIRGTRSDHPSVAAP